VLAALSDGYECLTAPEVFAEAQRGLAEHPAIGNLFAVRWLAILELDIFEAVRAATFKSELGGGAIEHLGECAVLALAESHGMTAVIDDRDGRRTGTRHGVAVAGSLSLVARGVRDGIIEMRAATDVVEMLKATDMYLPTSGADFPAWARAEGLLT